MSCFFKPYLSRFLNHYFINYYFTVLERIEFKLYFYYFMQTSPSCFIHNVLLKTPLLLENLFYYWVRIMCSLLKISGRSLIWIEVFLQKIWKNSENKKRKRKKEQKNTKGPGATNRPSYRSGPRPRKPIPNRYTLPSLTLTDSGPRLSVVFLLRPIFMPVTARARRYPLFNTHWCLPISIPPCAYK
jgi:hypothetical protein